MRPTPLQFIFGSRFTIPIWLGLGLWLWFSMGGDWDSFTQEQQIVLLSVGVVFALAFLKSFPTVFFYEREQARYRRSSVSPEERWQRATVIQTLFLVLVGVGLLYMGFQWWKSAPQPQPVSYKSAALIGGGSLLATTAYFKIKPYFLRKQNTDQPFNVSCCLPKPTHTAAETIELPDYCRRVLSASDRSSPAQVPAVQREVKS
jgi:hypothetical protein